MNVVVLPAWEDLAIRRREWRALADRCAALPEATPAWGIPRWRELGRGRLRAVAAAEDDGTLVGLGLFCESRAPGPKLVTALGRLTDPVVGMLIEPGRESIASAIVAAALGAAPAAMVIEGTDDRVLLADAAEHGLAVSSRPHTPSRLVSLAELAECSDGDDRAELRWGGDPRLETAGLEALTRAMGLTPGPETDRCRERAFLVTVLDAFSRAGELVWPIAVDGDRVTSTSAWLVRGDRASLWLRWSEGDSLVDVAAALDQLEGRGVSEVVFRSGDRLAGGRGRPIGGETLLVHNRPGWHRLESLAWKMVRTPA
ncbi:MAG: hypothetical protein KDB21_11195 [Acidimicrobiales bacterium]|nr:hypothetical protein [Acidimicrobiales bacterium]